MFKLRLNAKQCISCGVCMDVCPPQAIEMRISKARRVEGERLSYLWLPGHGDEETLPEDMMTFPFLAHTHLCDGCMQCIQECPVMALEVQPDIVQPISASRLARTTGLKRAPAMKQTL
jgi:ferredoxin